MDFLNFPRLPQLAIALGATSPDPGDPGAMVWSTTEGAAMFWDGAKWTMSVNLVRYGTSTKFRVVITGASGQAYAGFGEVQLLSAEAVVMSTGAAATASSQFDSAWPPSSAIDGQTNTDSNGWLTDSSGAVGQYIELTMGAPITPRYLKLFPVKNILDSIPSASKLQYYDGSSWVDIFSFSLAAGAAGVGQLFEIPPIAG